MAEAVTKDKLIGKYVEFFDNDNKYRIGLVKKVYGIKKIWVSVRLPLMDRNTRIPSHKIIGTITRSGLRKDIIW